MLKVGLTGGIGVGKTTIAQYLIEQGCHLFDADQIARAVVLPGSVGYQRVVAEFGSEILAADGQLDRAALGKVIFQDATKRQRLNEILHPLIIAEQDRLLQEVAAQDPQAIAIVDAALMIESGSYRRFDKLIVVHCAPEVQIARVMARNSLSKTEAEARIAAQMPSAEKLKYADFQIDTSGSLAESYQQTLAVCHQLKLLAADHKCLS